MTKIVIIGSGPAGISAALNSSKKGYETILIEKNKIGGLCLNEGCIPTKILLDFSKKIRLLKEMKNFGINVENVSYDLKQVQIRKNKIIEEIIEEIKFLLKTAKIKIIFGEGKIIEKNKVKVNEEIIETDYIIIAAGASEKKLEPTIHKNIISTSEALKIKKVPEKINIIGGGVIGIEFADIFNSLGAEVTIIEKEFEILNGIDSEISDILKKSFENRGIKIETDKKINNIEGDILTMIAIGMEPSYKKVIGANFEKIFQKKENIETNFENIFVIGDASGGNMLANKATLEGKEVIERISNNLSEIKKDCLPFCVYTSPEIACVGINEDKAKEEGKEVLIGKCYFSINSKAKIEGKKEGILKVIFDKKTKNILGAHMIGENATELIGEFSLAINSNLSIDNFKKSIHSHPTFSEIIDEAIKNIK